MKIPDFYVRFRGTAELETALAVLHNLWDPTEPSLRHWGERDYRRLGLLGASLAAYLGPLIDAWSDGLPYRETPEAIAQHREEVRRASGAA